MRLCILIKLYILTVFFFFFSWHFPGKRRDTSPWHCQQRWKSTLTPQGFWSPGSWWVEVKVVSPVGSGDTVWDLLVCMWSQKSLVLPSTVEIQGDHHRPVLGGGWGPHFPLLVCVWWDAVFSMAFGCSIVPIVYKFLSLQIMVFLVLWLESIDFFGGGRTFDLHLLVFPGCPLLWLHIWAEKGKKKSWVTSPCPSGHRVPGWPACSPPLWVFSSLFLAVLGLPCFPLVSVYRDYSLVAAQASPVDLPHPGIEVGSPALQADSLPAEVPGNPNNQLLITF